MGEPVRSDDLPGPDLGRSQWVMRRLKLQIPPAGCEDGSPWSTWLFLGGRGAGKTRAGAEWVWEEAARLGPGGRIALVAPTHHDARAVMLEGPSGVLRLPFRSGARFEPSMRRVRFPNGAVGLVFSAEEPERLRGPQFHSAWGDELCAWVKAEETLAMLRLGLRLGDWPRLMLTTTPKPRQWLRRLREEPGLAETRAGTVQNAANLAPGFEAGIRALYGGTRREAQELDGVVLDGEGALFTDEMIRAAKARARPDGKADRVVVAVDPPAGTLDGRERDSCGIVAAGVWRQGGRRVFHVLGDRTVPGRSPDSWARAVIRAADAFAADKVVAETNQGGAMVGAVLTGAGLTLPVDRVHATLSKSQRAEPVAALYEQGRVGHAAGLGALEEALMGVGEEGAGKADGRADRADALVWAITALNSAAEGPRVRGL